MNFDSTNPATGKLLRRYPGWTSAQLDAALAALPGAVARWSATALPERAAIFRNVARSLREGREGFARLISLEMGKLIDEARLEIDKCAWALEFFADHCGSFLAEEIVATEASSSFVSYEPLGTILAIMPWNFPFWQVFRAAVPALLAGNTVLLKHAPTVTGCALAVEHIFHEAGLPPDAFRSLLVGVEEIPKLLADPRIHGVSFTGSLRTGRVVAGLAGANVKKSVLELGGSDPFIVLEDADLEWTIRQATASRYLNAGQSCIAAKRFIVPDAIADEFIECFRALAEALKPGDPLDPASTLAPLARADLRDSLHGQVAASLAAGAVAISGCAALEGPGYFYRASLLDGVLPGMAAFDEELFGPVATVTRVGSEDAAVALANQTRYGLGGSVWTRDTERGLRIARRLRCGMAFVNSMVKSDPRLPCGGIKDSGYGRELAGHGVREFTNAKMIWVEDKEKRGGMK